MEHTVNIPYVFHTQLGHLLELYILTLVSCTRWCLNVSCVEDKLIYSCSAKRRTDLNTDEYNANKCHIKTEH